MNKKKAARERFIKKNQLTCKLLQHVYGSGISRAARH